MSGYVQILVIAAAVGVGLMAGLLFAFSIVVMRALSDLAPEDGLFAMQRINVRIINPLFLLVFVGSAVLCVAVAVVALRGMASPGAPLLLAGACAYLAGPLGVTVARNVPLNNRLAVLTAGQASVEWPRYVSAWLRWNHLRAALGVLASVLLCAGLALGRPGSSP